MQAQSPFLKFNASDARSHQSPRKKKLQSQLTLLSSPAPSNEFENLLTGDSKAAKDFSFKQPSLSPGIAAKGIGAGGIDIGNLLSDIAAHHPELESPYTRRGVTPSPVYQSRKDKDVLTDKIHSLEKQIKALQQANRETSLKSALAEESFRQALKTERGKLEKIITSLSTKLRDRNELIGDWISFVLNQPQYNHSFQSRELLDVMKKTVRVLPKLKNMLKPTMDSISEFERHRSRESSTHPNNLETDEILGEEEAEGDEEATEEEGDVEGEEVVQGGAAKKRRKKRSEKTSDNGRNKLTTADSDAEDLMSAIDEQIKMLEVLQGERGGVTVAESQKRHVVFKEAIEGEPTSDSEVAVVQSVKKKSAGKKGGKKTSKPPKAGAASYSEKLEEQRTKRLEEEDVTTAEITKLLYESRVMHNNVLELSKEKKPMPAPLPMAVTSQKEDNIFSTLFKETPEVSVDRLVATSETEMTGEGIVPNPDNTLSVTVAPEPATDVSNNEEKEAVQGRSEEVRSLEPSPAPAPALTPLAPALLSPAALKLQTATKKLTSVDEFMKSIDSEDFSYDDVLRELFDSVSGLSQSLGDMDEETNQLISKTATTSTSITSLTGKGVGKKKKSPAPPKDKKVVATAVARDSAVLLNTPLLDPQHLLAKLAGTTSITPSTNTSAINVAAPQANVITSSEEATGQRKEKKSRKKSLTSSLSEGEGEEEREVENEEAHDELLRNTNKLIEHIQLHLSGELAGGGDDVDSGSALKLGGQLDLET